jgi:hypothetical protein
VVFRDSINSLDIRELEKDGSLIIVGSKKAYSCSKAISKQQDISNNYMLIEHAKHSENTAVCLIADMGAFF